MVGRNEQIERILSAVDALPSSSGANVLFVTGEAGIGKSTLLAAVRKECEARSEPPTVAVAECSTPLAGQDIGEVESLEPWGRIMAALVTDTSPRAHDTRKLVAELAVAWVKVVPVVGDVLESLYDSTKILKQHFGRKDKEEPASSPALAASQQQIFQQYINFLEKLSERSPLVIMLDDFHWADTASTNLLFAAARQLQGRPALFIIAYRPDDAASSRAGEGHPLLHVRNELDRYSLGIDVGVPRMTPEEVGALITSRNKQYASNPRFESWLTRVSDGNALFITQFLNTLEDDGFIDRATGVVKNGFESIRVPASAHAVVQERVRRLSEEAREMLRYASVEGDTFTSAVLARITEVSALKLLQKLRLLEESHRIIRALGKQRVYAKETSAFQFVHVLLHKAMYEDLGEEERELLHEAVLDVLQEEWETAREEGTNVEGIAARLAVHARVLGRHQFAADLSLEGASAAWREYAAEETLHLLDDAATSLAAITKPKPKEIPAMERTRGGVHLHRSLVHRTRGALAKALEEAGAAREAFAKAGSRPDVVKAMVAESIIYRNAGDHERAEAAAREALTEAEATGDPVGEFDAIIAIGHVLSDRGGFAESIELFSRGLDVARGSGLRAKEAAALDNLGCAADSLGRYADAAAWYREAREIAHAEANVVAEAKILLNLGVLHFRVGEHADARAVLTRALDTFRTIGDRWNEMAVEINLGILEYHAGDLAAAGTRYRHALEIARSLGDARGEASVLINLGELEAGAGNSEAAVEHFTECLRIYSELRDEEGMAVACINLAEVHAQQTPSLSEGFAERARGHAESIGSRLMEAVAMGYQGMARAAAGQSGSADDARALVTECVRILREVGSFYADEWQEKLEKL